MKKSKPATKSDGHASTDAPCTRADAKEQVQIYEPTPEELAIVKAHFKKKGEALAPPRLKISEDGNNRISLDHPDSQIGSIVLAQALGSSSGSFVEGIISQLANASLSGGKPDEHGLNFMVNAVYGIKPQDEVETMLAAQMAAVHVASMTFARRLSQVETIEQQDSAERAFNKLTRTFAAQVEALKRYRNGGEQKVTVKHVTVNSGGQAIVGNVSHGEPADAQRAPQALLTAGNETAVTFLPSPHAEAIPVLGGRGHLEKVRSAS